MADLNTRTFTQLVQGQAAAVQARAAGLVDFSIGAIERAFAESVAAVVLWLQGLILAVMAMGRASTSTGTDLDSFVADYGGQFDDATPALITRLPASGAVGAERFSRFSPVGQVVVPVGALVATQDGSQRFVVVVDSANPAYSAALGGYAMPNTVAFVDAPVLAVTPGAASNATAGTVNTITSAIPGVDTAVNMADFTGGMDQETDANFRVRFRQFIASLREATPDALKFWVMSVQQGVSCEIIEFFDKTGAARVAYFYAVVDDGSGNPSDAIMDAATDAIEAHRAAGVQYAVYRPDTLTVNVSFTVETDNDEDHDQAAALAASAVGAFLASLSIGESLTFNRLFQVAYDASPAITRIGGMAANGSTSDISVTASQRILAGTITAS